MLSILFGILSPNGVQPRIHASDMGRVTHVNRLRKRINHTIARLGDPTRRSLSTGAVLSADLTFLRSLAGDLSPVEDDVRMSPAHITLVLRIDRIVADPHDRDIPPADCHGQISTPLLGGDNDSALAGTHRHISLWLLTDSISTSSGAWRARAFFSRPILVILERRGGTIYEQAA
jgi:hypothetical protein